MKGYVSKKKGQWYVILEIGEADRKQKWVSVRKELGLGAPATKSQAEKLLVKLLNDIEQNQFIAPHDLTVAGLFTKWLENYGKINLRPTTYGTYRAYISNHIIPEIGKIPLRKLKPLHLQQMYTKKLTSGRADGHEGGLSPSAVGIIHKIMSRSLTMAVRWELVGKNVAEAVSPPRITQRTKETWTSEEVGKFLSHISGHRLYALYVLAISTGMRRGEILGLRWQDIDWNGSLSIIQALVNTESGPMITETKTASGRRVVALSEPVLAVLKAHRKRQTAERMALGLTKTLEQQREQGLVTKAEYEARIKRMTETVFASEAGTPLRPDNLRRHFIAEAKKAGVPRIPFHSLRHTHATLLLQEGVHPKVVSERLGHSRIGVTLDVYSHVMPDMQASAATIMDKHVRTSVRTTIESV